MLLDHEAFLQCADIFNDALLAQRISGRISVLDIRDRLALAMDNLDWAYCHRLQSQPGMTVHATFFPEERAIVLYSSACDAASLYHESLTSYNLGHRFFLVTAHELGHAIDQSVGELPRISTPQAELRATWYGTFFAQCASRLWQNILLANSELDDSRAKKKARRCLLRKWKRLERDIIGLRTAIDRGRNLDPDNMEGRLASGFACASPSNQPATRRRRR